MTADIQTINDYLRAHYPPAIVAAERSTMWERFKATLPQDPVLGPTGRTLELMLEQQCTAELTAVLSKYNASISGDEDGCWWVSVDSRVATTDRM